MEVRVGHHIPGHSHGDMSLLSVSPHLSLEQIPLLWGRNIGDDTDTSAEQEVEDEISDLEAMEDHRLVQDQEDIIHSEILDEVREEGMRRTIRTLRVLEAPAPTGTEDEQDSDCVQEVVEVREGTRMRIHTGLVREEEREVSFQMIMLMDTEGMEEV